jgi:hypothetical protein
MRYLPTRNALLALSTALTAIAFVQPAHADEGPFGPIHVAANRSQYTGRGCPIEIIYTATINFVSPHPKGFVFNYHWERSDGGKGPQQVLRPSPNQRSMVIREKWRIGAPGKHYDASVTLFVNSGNAHLSQSSPTVGVTCR